MGQTPSKDNQITDLYNSYIQQQQYLIYQQQQQINELFINNLQIEQQMPSNMFFQNDINNNNNNNNNNLSQDLPKLPQTTKTRLDPYKILKISQNYDEKILKKAYLKAAMKSHPDRGGSEKEFQKISIAYTVLKQKLQEKNNNHLHDELKINANDYINNQNNQPKININMSDNFDIDLFNKIYNDNKLSDVYDEGYSTWMNSNPALESSQNKLFQNGFNKDLFNSTFDQYKNDKTKQQQNNGSIVIYQEPEVKISMNNQDSLMVLGRDKITDFGGSTDNLIFTDYKQAFTDGSTLIDPTIINTSDRPNSIRDIKSQRSNISYTMNSEDEKYHALKMAQEKQLENDRINRLNIYDNKHRDNYDKIHSLLLR